MEVSWVLATNVDAARMRPYRFGDRLVAGPCSSLEARPSELVVDVGARVLEAARAAAFGMGPDWFEEWPLPLVGDVLFIHTASVLVTFAGLQDGHVRSRDVIFNRSWLDVLADPPERPCTGVADHRQRRRRRHRHLPPADELRFDCGWGRR